MIPGVRCDVQTNLSRASYPTATVYIPCAHGTVGMHLTWDDNQPAVTWVATPGRLSLPGEPAPAEPHPPLMPGTRGHIDQTAACAVLVPLAQQWLASPMRRAESLALWLRRTLIEPQVVH